MRPMMASRGTVIPLGPGWAHEIKWDGMRILADVCDGELTLTSRNENDVTASFPELVALSALGAGSGPQPPGDLLLDGEVVALHQGLPSFAALAMRMHVADIAKARKLAAIHPVTYMVFDVLRLYGVDLTARPLVERRATLERIGLPGSCVQVPPTYDDGNALRSATLEQGLEGVVSKRLSSRYSPGRRSPDWLKFAHRLSRSVVVGGWRREIDNAQRLGAVLVGTPTTSGLAYLGRVGSGLAGKEQDRVLGALRDLVVDQSPFADEVPPDDALGTTWVRPEIVIEVEALGLSAQGRLRQPAYRGIRLDLSPTDLADQG